MMRDTFGPEDIKSMACQPGAGHRHILQVLALEIIKHGIDDIFRIKSAMHDGKLLIVLKFNTPTSYIAKTRSGL
jgi:hypothetical protein